MIEWIPTPCINECFIENNECTECGRTLKQIDNWLSYDDDEKWSIMEQLFNARNKCKSRDNN